jgi:cytochrome c/quinol oxidase subunit I
VSLREKAPAAPTRQDDPPVADPPVADPARELPPALEPSIAELDRTWADEPGLIGWMKSVDHKAIGRRYIATAFGFFLAGGLLAAAMRLQLSRPNNTFIGPDLYNQIFTTHGTIMMFLFAVPVMEAMAVYLVPLMIGPATSHSRG